MAHHTFMRRWKVHQNRQAMGGTVNSLTSGLNPSSSASSTTTSPQVESSSEVPLSTASETTSQVTSEKQTSSSATPTSSTETPTTPALTSESTTATSSSSSSTSSTSSTRSIAQSTIQPSTTPVTTTLRATTSVRTTSRLTRTSVVESSATSGLNSSASASNTSGGVSTGTVVGIAAACLVGLAIASTIFVILLRRYKRRKDEDEAFSAAQFRRSAVLLDDEFNGTGEPYIQRGNSLTGGNAGYHSSLRPPTMIERHMNNTPASFGNPQFAGYAPQPPMPAFGPGEIMGPTLYNEQDIRAAAYDSGSGDPFATTRDPYLTRQPSTASGMYHPEPAAQQYDYQQYPGAPQNEQYPQPQITHQDAYNDTQHEYSDLHRVSSDPGHPPVPASIIAAAGVATPDEHLHAAQSQTSPTDAAVIAARTPSRSAAKRPDTVYTTYDPDDAYGGM